MTIRARSGRFVLAAALVAAALAAAGTAAAWTRQPALERTAARFVGAGPTVVCETTVEHAQGIKAGKTAYYAFTMPTKPGLVVLSPSICRSLRARDTASTSFALAVYVLAHELGHVAKATSNETAAECFALAQWRRLAARLGLERPSAEQEATVSRAHQRLPGRYRGQCPAPAAAPET